MAIRRKIIDVMVNERYYGNIIIEANPYGKITSSRVKKLVYEKFPTLKYQNKVVCYCENSDLPLPLDKDINIRDWEVDVIE